MIQLSAYPVPDRPLSPQARGALSALKAVARQTGQAVVNRGTLAKRLHRSTRTVSRYTAELEAHGLVQVDRSPAAMRPNVYRLPVNEDPHPLAGQGRPPRQARQGGGHGDKNVTSPPDKNGTCKTGSNTQNPSPPQPSQADPGPVPSPTTGGGGSVASLQPQGPTPQALGAKLAELGRYDAEDIAQVTRELHMRMGGLNHPEAYALSRAEKLYAARLARETEGKATAERMARHAAAELATAEAAKANAQAEREKLAATTCAHGVRMDTWCGRCAETPWGRVMRMPFFPKGKPVASVEASGGVVLPQGAPADVAPEGVRALVAGHGHDGALPPTVAGGGGAEAGAHAVAGENAIFDEASVMGHAGDGLADAVGVHGGGADLAMAVHGAEKRASGEAGGGDPGAHGSDGAAVGVGLVRDADEPTVPGLVRLGAGDVDNEPLAVVGDVLNDEPGQVIGSKAAAEAEGDEGTVPEAARGDGEPMDNAQDVGGLEGEGLPLGHAELAAHAGEDFPDEAGAGGAVQTLHAVGLADGGEGAVNGGELATDAGEVDDVKPHGVGAGREGGPPDAGAPRPERGEALPVRLAGAGGLGGGGEAVRRVLQLGEGHGVGGQGLNGGGDQGVGHGGLPGALGASWARRRWEGGPPGPPGRRSVPGVFLRAENVAFPAVGQGVQANLHPSTAPQSVADRPWPAGAPPGQGAVFRKHKLTRRRRPWA